MDNLIELLNVFRSDKSTFLFNYIIHIPRSKSNRKGTGHLHLRSTVLPNSVERAGNTILPSQLR